MVTGLTARFKASNIVGHTVVSKDLWVRESLTSIRSISLLILHYQSLPPIAKALSLEWKFLVGVDL